MTFAIVNENPVSFTTFRTELETIAALGLQINLLIEGLSTSIDNVFVSNICDCLGFCR